MASWPGRIGDRRTFVALRRPTCRVHRGAVTVALADAVPVVPVRVAYGVGRAVGTSVVRNRTRRRLRAVMGEAYRQGELVPGSYLVSVGREAADLSFQELRAVTRDALVATRRLEQGRVKERLGEPG
jgi:ribonuclease P protein component